MCCVLKSPPRRPVSECRIDWVAREKYGNFENKLHKHNLCKCHFRDFFLQRQTIHWRFKVSWKMKWKKPRTKNLHKLFKALTYSSAI